VKVGRGRERKEGREGTEGIEGKRGSTRLDPPDSGPKKTDETYLAAVLLAVPHLRAKRAEESRSTSFEKRIAIWGRVSMADAQRLKGEEMRGKSAGSSRARPQGSAAR
jgi:hypothetical protein